MDLFQQRVELLTRTYDAWNRRDIDAVLRHLDDDVKWPNQMEMTTARGHRAVRAYWEKQFKVIDPIVEPLRFTELGEVIVVDVHQVVRDLDGAVLVESQVGQSFAFRGAKVRSMQVRSPIGG